MADQDGRTWPFSDNFLDFKLDLGLKNYFLLNSCKKGTALSSTMIFLRISLNYTLSEYQRCTPIAYERCPFPSLFRITEENSSLGAGKITQE